MKNHMSISLSFLLAMSASTMALGNPSSNNTETECDSFRVAPTALSLTKNKRLDAYIDGGVSPRAVQPVKEHCEEVISHTVRQVLSDGFTYIEAYVNGVWKQIKSFFSRWF